MQFSLVIICIYVVPKVSCEGCLESIPTITYVNRCPDDISEWIKSKSRKQCHLVTQNCTTLEGFEYHCLPDKFHERFMEVCAPRKNIVGGHCPFYDVEESSVELNLYQSCKEYTTPCPDFYNSSVSYRYQECYTDAPTKNMDANKEQTISMMVSVSTFVFQILKFIILFLILIVFVYFIKKHKGGPKYQISMNSFKRKHYTPTTSLSRNTSYKSISSQETTLTNVSIGDTCTSNSSQENTTRTISSREDSCKSNSVLVHNTI